ncbi:DUF6255 family natural product biosynthesis protein [Streptomyces sp. URMC 126]|uniref:DUF6255 family natural product biosynthesis protein n=1 Tax=Streptomyces sp. URMC 126 TaxID=3423401 RepID=UPI003F1D2B56
MMERTTGRLMRHCGHEAGWEAGGGAHRCLACGTCRFTEYGALRPPGPLPPGPPTPGPLRLDGSGADPVEAATTWPLGASDPHPPAANPYGEDRLTPAPHRPQPAAARSKIMAAWTPIPQGSASAMAR